MFYSLLCICAGKVLALSIKQAMPAGAGAGAGANHSHRQDYPKNTTFRLIIYNDNITAVRPNNLFDNKKP